MARVMKKRAALGTTIQSKPEFCPKCDGRHLIKHGLWKNTHRQLQV
jgi:competence CoiA-like predicted nuclease